MLQDDLNKLYYISKWQWKFNAMKIMHMGIMLQKIIGGYILNTETNHCYTNTITNPICKFATSQARLICHSISQPAYESLSTSWYILSASRSVPAGSFQTSNIIL